MNKQSTRSGRSRRRTSKLALGLNTGLAWGCAFYSLYTGQGAAVAGCLALIGGLYGSYVGVGHLDYRRFLSCLNNKESDNFFEDNPDFECFGSTTDPVDAGGMDEIRAGFIDSQTVKRAADHGSI